MSFDDLVRETRAITPPLPVENPDEFPQVYASNAVGTCLQPAIMDGAILVFDKEAEMVGGDYVAIWFKPGMTPAGLPSRMVKRLAMSLMPGLTLPYEAHPKSGVTPMIVVMTLNPERSFSIPIEAIAQMHRCTGEARPAGKGRAVMVSRFAPGGIREAVA